MLNFDSAFLFGSCVNNPVRENDDVLGDMIRVKTLVPGPATRQQAVKILDFFGLPDTIPIEHGYEYFMDLVCSIKMRVFKQMKNKHLGEWRVDWSRRDKAFCLWFRSLDTELDVTKDLHFVHTVTVDNMAHTKIHDSKVHGFGLFAEIDFLKGHLFTKLDGQLMTKNSYEHRLKFFEMKLKNLQNQFFMEWNIFGKTDLLLVRPFRTKYSYINHHTQNANVHLEQDGPLIKLLASKDIKAGEELFLDYRRESLPRSYFHTPTAYYLYPVDHEKF